MQRPRKKDIFKTPSMFTYQNVLKNNFYIIHSGAIKRATGTISANAIPGRGVTAEVSCVVVRLPTVHVTRWSVEVPLAKHLEGHVQSAATTTLTKIGKV